MGQLLLEQALVVALVASRFAGFIVVSPFPGESTPRQVKVGLVLVLAWFVASGLPPLPSGSRLGLDFGVVPVVVCELSIGVLCGLSFRTVLGAAEIGGELASQATGLGSASLFNPTTKAQETPISRLFYLVGAAVAVSTGTHRVVLGYLMETFRALPLGSSMQPGAAAPAILELVVASMTMGLRLALPVIAVALVAQVALALIARTAPALGVFQIGLPILVAAGLVVLGLSFPTIVSLLATSAAGVPDAIERLLGAAAR